MKNYCYVKDFIHTSIEYSQLGILSVIGCHRRPYLQEFGLYSVSSPLWPIAAAAARRAYAGSDGTAVSVFCPAAPL